MKFEKTEVMNFEGAFRGLRNPLESWVKSDSYFGLINIQYDSYEVDRVITSWVNNELSHINQDIAYLENQINQLINNKIKNEAMNEIMEKQFKADADAEINELKE